MLRKQSGFTLLELVVSFVIIAIAIAPLLSLFGKHNKKLYDYSNGPTSLHLSLAVIKANDSGALPNSGKITEFYSGKTQFLTYSVLVEPDGRRTVSLLSQDGSVSVHEFN